MSQLSEMRSRIADDLSRDDLSEQIDKAINRAIRYYDKEYFWFKDKESSFSTVTAQNVYTSSSDLIPTDIDEIDYIEVSVNSNSQFRIKPVSFSEIQAINPSGTTTQGYPSRYALFNDNIYLYPTPDAAYGVTIYYQQKYSELSSDAASNDFTTEAEDLIESRANWWINKRIIRDYEAASAAKAEEVEALQSLRVKTSKLLSTNHVKRHNF